MQKDQKIGMFVGLVLVAGAMVYFSTLPGLSPRARLLKQNSNSQYTDSPTQSFVDPLAADDVVTSQPDLNNGPNQVPQNQMPDKRTETVYVEGKYQTQKFYVVRKGDTLSRISRVYYGSPNKWYKIYEANRDQLDNPDILKPGMKLCIPN